MKQKLRKYFYYYVKSKDGKNIELIKLYAKRMSEGGTYYKCEITDELNKIVKDDKFLLCNKRGEYIYRIHYNNISIGDLMCDTTSTSMYNNMTKFTFYAGNLEYLNDVLSNSAINEIYKYLKSLENNVYFARYEV